MPIYEYVCPDCGHAFDKRVGFSESDAPQSCPACGSDKARRQISLVGFVGGDASAGRTAAVPVCGPST